MTTVLDRRKDPTAAPLGAADGFAVEPVNRQKDQNAYAPRQKIYPRLAHGFYRRIKWIVMAATVTIAIRDATSGTRVSRATNFQLPPTPSGRRP